MNDEKESNYILFDNMRPDFSLWSWFKILFNNDFIHKFQKRNDRLFGADEEHEIKTFQRDAGE